jgi:hypothetical protein
MRCQLRQIEERIVGETNLPPFLGNGLGGVLTVLLRGKFGISVGGDILLQGGIFVCRVHDG